MTNISSNINLPSGAPYSSTPSQTYTPAIPRDDYEVLTPGTHPVPQGASKVLIRNSGIVDITVNGKPVEPGGQHPFETWVDETTGNQYFSPAYTIVVPANGKAWVYEERP